MRRSAHDAATVSSRRAAGYDRRIIDYIQRAAAHGLYEIRGLGAKRRVPHFDDLVFLGASLSRYPLEGYREKCDTKTVLGTRFAKQADRAGDSDHDRRHELRRAVGEREGGARPRGDRVGTSTTTGDGGMTPEERRVVEDAGLPVPAVALRLQSGRPAPGRRHRGRHRPGRKARRRRHAAGAEGQPARRADAHAAGRHRSALRLPASGLDRARRPGHQDPASCARSPTGRSRST